MAGKKRAGNVNRKESRKRSWIRAQARNDRNRLENEQKRDFNLFTLTSLGGTIKTKVSGKRESPSEAVARTKREANGWTGHVPMPTDSEAKV